MWQWYVTWGLIVFLYLAARFEAYYILWERTEAKNRRLEARLRALGVEPTTAIRCTPEERNV